MPNPQFEPLQGRDRELDTLDEGVDEAGEVEAELEALFGLSQIDAEVAVAYEIVAQDVETRAMRDALLEYAGEHRRHAAEIEAYLKQQGVEPAGAVPDAESSAVATLANALSTITAGAGLRSLQACEYLTNAAYSALLEVCDEIPARQLIERHLADERRHAHWLADRADAEGSATHES